LGSVVVSDPWLSRDASEIRSTLGVTVVPEPAGMLVGLGWLPMLGRRRRGFVLTPRRRRFYTAC
jgi:hypothetical protein